MNHHRRPIIAGLGLFALTSALMLAGPAPAAGQGSASDDEVIQTSITRDAAGPQDTYRSRVRGEMAEWRRKMQAFEDRSETNGKRRAEAAEIRLRAAWNDTEVEARHVQVATARGWERATRSYEAASRRMAAAWDKVRL
jgi:hypothetical protein